MRPSLQQTVVTVALVGNPNTGKSTLFGVLAGVHQRTGNYPGVTVEKKTGQMEHGGKRFLLVDLPGTYSLAPRSPDEMVAVDVLLGRRDDVSAPDVILSIVDASNLERNLYLVSQVLSLGRPTVVALNMTDVAESRGLRIDIPQLEARLGVPVVPIQAHRRNGIGALRDALAEAAQSEDGIKNHENPFPPPFNEEVESLEQRLGAMQAEPVPRYLVERLLLDTSGYVGQALPRVNTAGLGEHVTEARQRLSEAGLPVPAVEAIARYGWIGQVLEGVVHHPPERRVTLSDRVDRVLTHRLLGTVIFALLMLLLFSTVFVFADVPMGWIDAGIGVIGASLENSLPEGALRSLLVEGVVGGVGAVLVFLPQILILFFFIAVLEDCGYMARAAFLMDKLMARVGLSGKSFIPLLSSFACAIPGILSTRVIDNRRDRLTTILVAPLMSCSARLPVYTILIGAFIPQRRWLGGLISLRGITFLSMYLLGIVTAVVVALVLKRTLLAGETPPFVLELPSYKFPSPRTVLMRMAESGGSFVKRAGTLIFAVAIVVWGAAYYPQNGARIEAELAQEREQLVQQVAALPAGPEQEALAAELAEWDDPQVLEAHHASLQERYSYLGRAGQLIEPAVRPLGWDCRIGSAVIASFPAREVVVGVLGVIYNLGSDLDIGEGESQTRLQQQLRQARWDESGQPVFTTPTALSLLVFFALCAQCAATLAVVRRETNSWGWPLFTFGYMTTLAYLGALLTYQIGSRLG